MNSTGLLSVSILQNCDLLSDICVSSDSRAELSYPKMEFDLITYSLNEVLFGYVEVDVVGLSLNWFGQSTDEQTK